MNKENIMKDAKYWIEKLKLAKHPEGGYFYETYRSSQEIEFSLDEKKITRAASTAIYYLLKGNEVSCFHRIKSDEMWHFYAGSDLTIFILNEDGELVQHKLGNGENSADALFQILIPAGLWFAASVDDPSSFALVGCTVAPGFEFADFELADRKKMIEEYPWHEEVIVSLTKE
jgi:uncharacterized protein